MASPSEERAVFKAPPLSRAMIGTSLSSVLFTLLTFVSGVVLARCLGETGRGQYGAAYFWAQFLVSFGSLSFFEAAIVRREPQDPPEPYLSSMMATSMMLAIIAIGLFACAVALGLVQTSGVPTGLLLGFVAVCAGLSMLSRSMATVENMRRNFSMLNIERVFSPLVFTVLVVCVGVFFRDNLPVVMLAFVVSGLPLLVIRLHRFRRHLLSPLKPDFAKGALSLGAKFHVAATLTLIATQLDRLIIVSAWPADRLGHYFVAMSVAGAGLAVVSQALGLTLLPTLAVAGSQAARRDRLERLLRYTLLVTVVFVALIYVVAPFAIPFVYGAGFSPAVAYAQGLALALAPTPLRTIVLEANRSRGKDRPGVEMALAALATFLAVFAVTRLAAASDLFWAIGLSNAAAILVGLRHPVRAGDIGLAAAVIPRPGDVGYLARQLLKYAKEAVSGPLRKIVRRMRGAGRRP